MRVKLSREKSAILFRDCGKISVLAFVYNVSPRTVRNWKNGSLTMPVPVYDYLLNLSGLTDKDLLPIFLSDNWYTRMGASRGGIISQKLYGNPGTTDGRKRGGQNSQDPQ